jgi:hypothetical protein
VKEIVDLSMTRPSLRQAVMKAVAYFTIRALEYERRAVETTDLRLKEAYGAIAADMWSKAATADPNSTVIVVDGEAID